MVISFTHSGSFNKSEAFLRSVSSLNILGVLQSAAKEGVTALAKATPVDTRLASSSWGSVVSGGGGVYTISWTNRNVEGGFDVAIMLQYGYATGTGGYVQGRDYINPAMAPVFDSIANKVWKAVTSA
jgi:hypothetical protein